MKNETEEAPYRRADSDAGRVVRPVRISSAHGTRCTFIMFTIAAKNRKENNNERERSISSVCESWIREGTVVDLR